MCDILIHELGTEELAHLEMIGTIVHQLTDGLTPDDLAKAGLDAKYVNHGFGIYPMSAAGDAWTAQCIQSKGDPIVDLYEDMAAEEKARKTYEYILNLVDDPDVREPIKFLREREIVHFQRFGESLMRVKDYLNENKVFSIKKPDCMKPPYNYQK